MTTGIIVSYPAVIRDGEERYRVEPACPLCADDYVKLVQFKSLTVAYICAKGHRRLSFRKGVVALR